MSKLLTFIKDIGIVWKTAAGSALSYRLAELAGSSHPYLAPITLILSLQATLHQSVHFAFHRMFGTALGILITVILAGFFSVSYWTIGLLIFIGTAIAKLFKMSNLVIHQIGLSILLVFTIAHKAPNYGIDRLRDTIIGALVAFALAVLLFPSDLTRKVKQQFHLYTDELIANISEAASWTANGCPASDGARLHQGTQKLLKDLHQLENQLKTAMEDFRYNPYSKKHKQACAELKNQLVHLQQGYTHVSGMLRTLMEWSETGAMKAYDHAIWSSYLYTLAAYISEWKNDLEKNNTARSSIQIHLPQGLEKSLHPLALYHEAREVLKDFMPTMNQRLNPLK
ncbi:MAG: FUSC family protein [Tuberibacillus sp.]